MKRYAGLDGLRGLAALIVVLHHASLTFPAFVGGADASVTGAPWPGEQWAIALQQSPLNLFFAGPQAVWLFFVLSGFVLTLPFDRGNPTRWIAYYPKRLCRLYLPIIGGVVFALVTLAIAQRTVSPDQTWWMNSHAVPVTVTGVLRDMVVVFGAGRYNSVLWSLVYEVIFSMLLPVYVLLGRLTKQWWLIGTLAMISLTVAGAYVGSAYLFYMPMFGVGVYLALGRTTVHDWVSPHPARRSRTLLASGLVILASTWIVPSHTAYVVFTMVSSGLLLAAFLTSPTLVQRSSGGGLHWLGSRSFSLYLVHEPIIVTLVLLTGNPVLGVALSVALVPALTELFFRGVEDPSRRLANSLARVAGGRAPTRIM